MLQRSHARELSHSLPGTVATINPQIRARHKAARLTNEEHSGAAVLLGLAELAQHILRGPVPFALGVLLEQRLDHGRHDVARRDGVHADAVLAPLGGEVAAELEHASFGGVVGGADEALWRLG